MMILMKRILTICIGNCLMCTELNGGDVVILCYPLYLFGDDLMRHIPCSFGDPCRTCSISDVSVFELVHAYVQSVFCISMFCLFLRLMLRTMLS